jgi:hypothetical protein
MLRSTLDPAAGLSGYGPRDPIAGAFVPGVYQALGVFEL